MFEAEEGEGILAEQHHGACRCWRGGIPGAAPAQGVLCGAARRPLCQALSSPTQGHEKTFLLSSGKYQGTVKSHLGWRSLSQGSVCAQSCIFASLSPKSGSVADHNSCGELEFPKAL